MARVLSDALDPTTTTERQRKDSEQKVVCGVDDSADAVEVVRVAANLARERDLGLVLIHVDAQPIMAAAPLVAYVAPGHDYRADMRHALVRLAALAAEAGVDGAAQLRVEAGDPAVRLLAAARAASTALIVIGSRTRGAWRRALHGSVSAVVVAKAACPVLVIPSGVLERQSASADEADRRFGWNDIRGDGGLAPNGGVVIPAGGGVGGCSIVCGVDGSTESEAALCVASTLAGELGLHLVVAHVAPASRFATGDGPAPVIALSIEQKVREGRALLRQIASPERIGYAEQRSLYGFPAERLAALADEEHADMIVVGSRGRGAFKAALLGSVSNDLIGAARRPVLVVSPSAAREADTRLLGPTRYGKARAD